MAFAIEVLPVPGGPHRMTEGRRPQWIAERRRESPARRWSWPTISSSTRGRIRSDSGACGGGGVDSEQGVSGNLRRFGR